MIDHAIDREELEDIRRMILEAADLSFGEKSELSDRLEKVYKAAPELRK
jgi:hypothetical protein